MADTHFEQLAKRLATFALGVLDDLERKELDAGGPIHDVEVKLGFTAIRPHIPALAESLLDRIYVEFGNMSIADLMADLNSRKAQRPAP